MFGDVGGEVWEDVVQELEEMGGNRERIVVVCVYIVIREIEALDPLHD
jgi:hypothetical protein